MSNQVLNEVKGSMNHAIDFLKTELKAVRVGRANPAILDRVMVEYYGTPTPLNQMATITAPEPRMITISPYDKTTIGNIEKAIIASDLGFNPSNDGKIVRIVIPMLTEDSRKQISKDVKKMGEDAKVSIRNIRRDSNDKLKKMEKNKEITEDDLHNAIDKVQEHTDNFIKEIDKIIEVKIKEVMEV